jgi:hypothetical protein
MLLEGVEEGQDSHQQEITLSPFQQRDHSSNCWQMLVRTCSPCWGSLNTEKHLSPFFDNAGTAGSKQMTQQVRRGGFEANSQVRFQAARENGNSFMESPLNGS